MEENYIQILNAFAEFYQPVNTFAESDDQLSTLEIAEKIQELTLEKEINGYELYTRLQEYGYSYKLTPEGFRWLLKIKHKPYPISPD